jgi:hypothetical protein
MCHTERAYLMLCFILNRRSCPSGEVIPSNFASQQFPQFEGWDWDDAAEALGGWDIVLPFLDSAPVAF